MAPSLLSIKSIRRRSKASFKTEKSSNDATDASSDASNGRTPTSGSLTPPSAAPSVAGQSDIALHQQLSKERLGDPSAPPVPPMPQLRPPLRASTNGTNRHSVNGMTGIGSPALGGRGPQPQLPVSPYAPQIENIRHGAWVSPDIKTMVQSKDITRQAIHTWSVESDCISCCQWMHLDTYRHEVLHL